jgi:hypothetical protein
MKHLFKIAFEEVAGMFVDDGALAILALGLILIVTAAVKYAHLDALAGGVILLIGCILILLESLWRASRKAGKR